MKYQYKVWHGISLIVIGFLIELILIIINSNYARTGIIFMVFLMTAWYLAIKG